MEKISKPFRTVLSAAIGAVFVVNVVDAGSFSLYTEGSTTAVGNYAAGIAAEVADASIGWYNPAGLVFLDKEQALLSGVGVFPITQLSGSSTFATPGLPDYVERFEDLQPSKKALVPAFHYALPLTDRAAFGLSILSPFGLSTNYATTSPVRYAATFTELLSVTVSPELAGKLSDNFSIGAGLDLQWARVKFNRMLGAPTLEQALGDLPTALDSLSYNKGYSFGVGFHAGVLGMFNMQHTRVGLNYQSRMSHTFHGYSELRGPLADLVGLQDNSQAVFRSDTLYSNDAQFPDIVTLSAYQDVNERFALLGSIVYTGWSVFKEIQLNNVAAFSLETGPTFLTSTSDQDYRDAWRFAVGANYKANDQWLIRLGAGYDQTPTVNAERDMRLPDADRWALAVGAHYQMKPCLGFDVGYAYLFADGHTTINKTDPVGSSTYNVTAQGRPHAQLFGLQAVWTMDKDIEPVK